MILDSEEQKQFLLEALMKLSYPGTVLEMAYKTRKAVEEAKIADTGTASKQG